MFGRVRLLLDEKRETGMFMRQFFMGVLASLSVLSLDMMLSYDLVRNAMSMPVPSTQVPDSDCAQLAAGWSSPEQFIWAQTCAGKIADFNRKLKKYADPRIPNQIAVDERRVSSEFLETILFEKPFRDAVTRHGVRIRGAHFNREIDISQGHIAWPLELTRSRFERDFNVSGLHADREVSLRESCFVVQVDLSGTIIGGSLDMTATEVEGTLNMASASIGNHVGMGPLNFWDDSAGLVTIRTKIRRIKLNGSKIAGDLDMTGVTIEDLLDMDAAVVGGHLKLRNAAVRLTHLRFATIGLSLFLTDGKFRTVGLRGTTIQGELHLNGSEHEWLVNPVESRGDLDEIEAHLNLQNTIVGTVMVRLSAWPEEKVELDGFTYRRLSGLEDEDFVEWLERDNSFSFQPYHQLASVLRNLGDFSNANQVLYAGRNAELCHKATRFLRRAWLAAAFLFGGYGIGVYAVIHTLAWVLGFTAVGGIVLRCSGEYDKHCSTLGERIGIWFSFDYFLPAIRLREAHYDKVDLHNRHVRRYFYFHQFFGYVIGFFFIGGATGALQ